MRVDPLALLAGDVWLAARDLDNALRARATLDALDIPQARAMATQLRMGAHRSICAAGMLERHASRLEAGS